MTTTHYSYSDLLNGLQQVGICKGDVLFIQMSLGMLGKPDGAQNQEQLCEMWLRAIQEILGSEGTILVPVYTYSFCKGELFDLQNTSTTIGPFPEYFRLLPNVVRSRDPIFSVAGLGPQSEKLLTDLPQTCFGKGSIYDRIRKINAKICLIGLSLNFATFRHHVEEIIQVPFRFKKKFTGKTKDREDVYQETWVYNVKFMTPNCYPDGSRLDKKAREIGLSQITQVGRSEILAIKSQEFFELTYQELTRDPWYTAKGPAINPIELKKNG